MLKWPQRPKKFGKIIREDQGQSHREQWERDYKADREKIIAALEGIKDGSKRAYQEQQTTDTARETRERRRFWLDVAAVVAVFLAAGFSAAQWHVLSGQQIVMQGQLKEMQRAYGPLKDTATAAIIANRAWISPRLVELAGPIQVGQPIKIQVVFDDAGKTPALEVEFHGQGKYLKSNDGRPLAPEAYRNIKFGLNIACDAAVSAYIGAIYPASNFAGNYSAFDIGENDPTIVPAVIGRTMVIGVQGCYKYKTMGSWHSSKFCSYLEPDPAKPPAQWVFKNCGDGSDAD